MGCPGLRTFQISAGFGRFLSFVDPILDLDMSIFSACRKNANFNHKQQTVKYSTNFSETKNGSNSSLFRQYMFSSIAC